MKQLTIPILTLFLLFFTGCEEEDYLQDFLPGFWEQESILVDGNPVTMTACETSTRLLIEQNGVYRLHSSCDAIERSGTWLIYNDSILNLSMDRWNGSNSYEPYPIRFSILTLDNNELEIRIKTFIGERKKIVMLSLIHI